MQDACHVHIAAKTRCAAKLMQYLFNRCSTFVQRSSLWCSVRPERYLFGEYVSLFTFFQDERSVDKGRSLHGEFALAGQRAPDGSQKKIAMIIGIIVLVLLAVRVYLSQQGPALHHWHTWRADEMSVQEMDNATFAAYVARENAIFTALDAEVTANVTPQSARR